MGRAHTNKLFAAELSAIRLGVIEMGGIVELMIANSAAALTDRACDLAERVIAADSEINRLEVEIDQRCFELLARHQPTACDLRLTTTALKTVTDLERIGDHCVSIAREALELNKETPLNVGREIRTAAVAVGDLVKRALDAFVTGNTDLALEVASRVETVHRISGQLQKDLVDTMQQHPAHINRAVRLDSVSRYLERIADRATNIAKMVIFMVDGKDVRHRTAPGNATTSKILTVQTLCRANVSHRYTRMLHKQHFSARYGAR